MAENNENTLVVSCSDKRLGAKFLASLEERFGEVYRIQVPGPDAGIAGNKEHLEALLYFIEYFMGAKEFSKIIFISHENCAGCDAEVEDHKKYIADLGKMVRSKFQFNGSIESYCALRPKANDHELWMIEETD